jgi:predicted dehydrogenase
MMDSVSTRGGVVTGRGTRRGAEMARLGVGVIGLGRRWPAYQRALGEMRSEVLVRAIHDPVTPRAVEAARGLRCESAGGVIELVERDDVEAVLLLGSPWFGLWPIEHAARAGKPVFCSVSPLGDEAYLEELASTLRAGARIHLPASAALDRMVEEVSSLLKQTLGRARLVQASWATRRDEPILQQPGALALLHACTGLVEATPSSVQATTTRSAPNFASLTLDSGEGRVVQLTLWASPTARPGCTLQVQAENGAAWAELPADLSWTDGRGRHALRLSAHGAERRQLERFVRAVRQGGPMPCPLADVRRAAAWLRAARRSLAEGRPVGMEATQPQVPQTPPGAFPPDHPQGVQEEAPHDQESPPG